MLLKKITAFILQCHVFTTFSYKVPELSHFPYISVLPNWEHVKFLCNLNVLGIAFPLKSVLYFCKLSCTFVVVVAGILNELSRLLFWWWSWCFSTVYVVGGTTLIKHWPLFFLSACFSTFSPVLYLCIASILQSWAASPVYSKNADK